MAAAELPFVVVFCSSESSVFPAASLEEPGSEGWLSDARHRFPVEIGCWVGDVSLEGLRVVAHERLAPRRVEVYAASGTADAPKGDAFSTGPGAATENFAAPWRDAVVGAGRGAAAGVRRGSSA